MKISGVNYISCPVIKHTHNLNINKNTGHDTVSFKCNKQNNTTAQSSAGVLSAQSVRSNKTENILDITKSKKAFSSFIQDAIDNPRNSQATAKKLITQAGTVDNFLNWYLSPGGYKDCYSEFIKDAVDKAEKPEELLKISPNWGYWVFENKFGPEFFIGDTPSDIGTKEDFQNLVTGLLKGEQTQIPAKELKSGMSGKRAFLIDTGEHKYVLKTQQDYLIYSPKLKKAIDEDSWLKDSFLKNYKENEQMKSDSSYMNAMLDFYLNLNNCPNGLKIHCFDAKTSSVLYDFAQGEEYSGDIDILSVNNLMPDLNKLGIIYNDVSGDNLRVNNGEIKIIDSGESNFVDLLKPTVPGMQIEMPNWSGNNIISTMGAIKLLQN